MTPVEVGSVKSDVCSHRARRVHSGMLLVGAVDQSLPMRYTDLSHAETQSEQSRVDGWGCRSITAYAIYRFISRGDTEGTEKHPPSVIPCPTPSVIP
jgi:hypothetical protein